MSSVSVCYQRGSIEVNETNCENSSHGHTEKINDSAILVHILHLMICKILRLLTCCCQHKYFIIIFEEVR